MFSDKEIQTLLNDPEIIDKYSHYLSVFGYAEGEKPKDLEEWVNAIAQGECGGFSLKVCVLGVIEAAIHSRMVPYDQMILEAQEGASERIMNAGLDPTLERRLIEFNEGKEPTEPTPTKRIDLDRLKNLNPESVNIKYEMPTPPEPAGLSMEQQFMIRSFEGQADQMAREQAIDFLKQMYRHMVCRESIFKTLLRKQWGVDT